MLKTRFTELVGCAVPIQQAGMGVPASPALAAGASAVRVGTRFVAAAEAAAHPIYLDALFRARASDTVYAEAFGRQLAQRSSPCIARLSGSAQRFEGDVVAEFTSPYSGQTRVFRRFDAITLPGDASGHIEATPHWAGEGIGRVRKVQPAAEIVQEMAGEPKTS